VHLVATASKLLVEIVGGEGVRLLLGSASSGPRPRPRSLAVDGVTLLLGSARLGVVRTASTAE
jgi:hypothetical protein